MDEDGEDDFSYRSTSAEASKPSSDAGELASILRKLDKTSPQNYGYLRNNWREAKQGLDNTDRSYAQARRIYTNIPDPDLNTRTLGNTLRILEELQVIQAESKRNNPNVYDLTTYQPEKLETIGQLLTEP